MLTALSKSKKTEDTCRITSWRCIYAFAAVKREEFMFRNNFCPEKHLCFHTVARLTGYQMSVILHSTEVTIPPTSRYHSRLSALFAICYSRFLDTFSSECDQRSSKEKTCIFSWTERQNLSLLQTICRSASPRISQQWSFPVPCYYHDSEITEPKNCSPQTSAALLIQICLIEVFQCFNSPIIYTYETSHHCALHGMCNAVWDRFKMTDKQLSYNC